ncbi:unnamed protein product, partial [Mesorhabditis spiculigera]
MGSSVAVDSAYDIQIREKSVTSHIRRREVTRYIRTQMEIFFRGRNTNAKPLCQDLLDWYKRETRKIPRNSYLRLDEPKINMKEFAIPTGERSDGMNPHRFFLVCRSLLPSRRFIRWKK